MLAAVWGQGRGGRRKIEAAESRRVADANSWMMGGGGGGNEGENTRGRRICHQEFDIKGTAP